MRNISISVFQDQFGSCGQTPEEEFADLSESFREEMSEYNLIFKTNVKPRELSNANPDIYLFDIGGMCYVDHSYNLRDQFCKDVCEQIDSHPNTLFVAWSEFTSKHFLYIIEEEKPELLDHPNVVMRKWGEFKDSVLFTQIKTWLESK